jgi:hypothetical protein
MPDETPASAVVPVAEGFSLSWDQCYCTKPTGKMIPPYVDIRYDPGPGCLGARSKEEYVWFNCDDASALLRPRCACRSSRGLERRSVWGCQAATLPRAGRWEDLLECGAIESAGREIQGRCFCRSEARGSRRSLLVERYNWSKECAALRPLPGWDLAALPSCRAASAEVGRCFCQGSDGKAVRVSSEGACVGLDFVSLILRTAYRDPVRTAWSLPLCGARPGN